MSSAFLYKAKFYSFPNIIFDRLRIVGDAQEEIYSTMFSSLKHPARRKILRILSEKPLSFSEMLELLGVSSPNLTYHLESLGELVTRDEIGVYRLSTFGLASVNTMRVVEEAPEVQPKKRLGLSFKWKTVLGILLIGLIVFASMAVLQSSLLSQTSDERDDLRFKYNQLLSWSGTTNSAIKFFADVVQINTAHYQATLLSNTIEQRSDLGGAVEQVMTYSLTSSDSKLHAILWFRNNQFYRYQLSALEGAPVYWQPQPSNAVDSAKGLIERLSAYESAAYLANMSALLALVNSSTENMEIKEGNMKLTASQGDAPKIGVMYTENGVDFSPKSLVLEFADGDLAKLTDGWYLFTVGSTTVNISPDKAQTIARNALNGYSWTADGATVSDFTALPEPASVVFHPTTKNGLALYPQYTVTFHLDKVYPGGVNSLTVQVWADTGEIAQITR